MFVGGGGDDVDDVQGVLRREIDGGKGGKHYLVDGDLGYHGFVESGKIDAWVLIDVKC